MSTAAQLRYDILAGADWRIALDARDRYTLKPIMEDELEHAGQSLVHTIKAATSRGAAAWWVDAASEMARRAHRYARILEVVS